MSEKVEEPEKKEAEFHQEILRKVLFANHIKIRAIDAQRVYFYN